MFVENMKITEEVKQCIRNLEKSFKRELVRRRPLHRYEHVAMRIASCLNLSRSTVYRVLREDQNASHVVEGYHRQLVKDRRERRKKIDEFDQAMIRREVHSMYNANQYVSIRKLCQVVASRGLRVSNTTMRKTLKKIGFKYYREHGKRFMKETQEIVAARHAYLRKIRKYRNEGYQIVYIDETWVNSNHTCAGEWTENRKDYTYYMEYGTFAYTNDKDKYVIERLVAENSQANQVNPNLPTLANMKAVLVTWNIIDNADTTKENRFQLAMLKGPVKTVVFYIYGDMLLQGISGNVRGYIRGGPPTLSGRVCNHLDPDDPANLATVDNVLPDAELKDYSNFKCKNPGVYVFSTTAASDACAGTATDCATAYGAAMAKPNCNVTMKPIDTCTESSYCTRAGTAVTLTISAKWYAHTTPYIQALKYTTWVGNGEDITDSNPVMEQEFIPLTSCGKQLATTSDRLVITFNLDDTVNDRCGIEIVTGPPLVIKFATKIFEWDGTGTAFGPNQMFDRPGDLIIYGLCYPDETPLSISKPPVFNDASLPTELPTRSRSLVFKAVDELHDTNAQELSAVQIGRKYFLRICFDRGSPYNENADPFGIHVTQCTVANTADFTGAAVYTFISGGCSVDATVGPLYLGQAFKVRSNGAPNTYAFGTTTEPWCQYTGVITAARWNKFLSGSLADKLYFRCIVDYCTVLDGASGTDEKFCHNSCVGGSRRKRNEGNATAYPQEVVYASLLINEPEETTLQESCSTGATNFAVAIATVGALATLVAVVTFIEALLFLKLMRVINKRKK